MAKNTKQAKKRSKKQPLQEIYGEADNDPEVTDEEVGKAFAEIVSELKAKYGDEWTNHLSEDIFNS